MNSKHSPHAANGTRCQFLINEEMLDRFALRGTWTELPAKLQKKYHGLLDRVSYYFPLVPGENEAGWRATAAGFKR